jgi:MFS transporter, DHA1 family, multidrug resistance protein
MPAIRPSQSGLPGWLILIGVMTGIGPVSIDLYLPAFPTIEASFGERGIERTMASYLIGLALGQLVYGPLSDRFGRKPPLYFGFVLYSLGAIGCALAANMTMLTFFRIVQAAGACSGIAIGRAIVRDRCEPEQAARAFSTLMTIVSVAPILAPIAGGFMVAAFDWRAIFWVQAALGLGIVVAVHFTLQESRDPRHVQALAVGRVARTYGELLRDRAFMGYTLIGGFGMAALFCYVAGAPTILKSTYGVEPQTFGLIIGLNGIAFMTASRLNMFALRKQQPAALVKKFIWLPVLCGCVMVFAGALPSVPLAVAVILQFCFFVTTARVLPNLSALALAPHARDAGAASALLGALQSLAAMLTGIAIAVLNNGTLIVLAGLMTGSVTIAALLHRWTMRSMPAV